MKCPGAETLLRALIDNDEGVRGAEKRYNWLIGQDAAYIQELGDAAWVMQRMCANALAAKRMAAAVALTHEPASGTGAPR